MSLPAPVPLQSTMAAGETLVLLHGWGCDRRSWQPLLVTLGDRFNCLAVDLPGFANQPECEDVDQYLATLIKTLPASFVLLGWSLGGMLATRMAALYPQRVKALITLASSACFVARPDWPHAMPASVFDSFCRDFEHAPRETLKRFAGLLVKDDRSERRLLRPMRSDALSAFAEAGGCWQSGLQWLAQLDNRDQFSRLAMPGLHLLAAEDALVPVAVERDLRELNGRQRVELLPNLGHALHWSNPGEVAERIFGFVATAGHAVAKRRIAQSFGKAAPNYDSVAELQRRVGHHLLKRVDQRPGDCLDLGSGTGYFMPYLAQRFSSVTGLDLAEGMLRYAREKHGAGYPWVCGDAEQLPLADRCLDAIFSAMAVQWCANIEQLFVEIRRVLRPGGRAHVATLGPGTLAELRCAWSDVDGYTHVNQFASATNLRAAIETSGLGLRHWRTESIVLRYDQIRELTYELKTLGAHNMNSGQSSGLTGRQRITRFKHAYERFRDAGQKLPATYEVFYLELEA